MARLVSLRARVKTPLVHQDGPWDWRWVPAGVFGSALVLLGAASALWATSGAGWQIPATPVELGPVLSGVGAFVLWRQRENRIGALVALTGLSFSLVSLAAAILAFAVAHPGVPSAAQQAALAVGWAGAGLPLPWMLLVLWFPDGQFASAGWRRSFAIAAGVAVAVAIAGYLFATPGRLPAILAGSELPRGLGGPLANSRGGFLTNLAGALLALPLIALPALVGRYRRSDVLVRQQIRWLLLAAATTIVASAAASGLEQGPGATHTAGVVLSALVQPLPSLAIAVAILRYRLWDIDVVISRTLVYGLLWALLSGLFVVPALVSGLLVGGSGAATGVAAALVVTVVFQPLRRRTERAVEARLYKARRLGAVQLARFGEALRGAVDFEELGPRLADVLHDALGVAWAAVWLHVRANGATALRVAGRTGIETPAAVVVSAELIESLRSHPQAWLAATLPHELGQSLPSDTAMAVPLVAGQQLIGVVACGQRSGEPLGEADIGLIERFAGECALGLRSLRLDAELRAKLDEIETQAEELRVSRQRLVRAQDEERRRIERDLHDGAQQQLVNLVIRIRQLANSLDSDQQSEWERLIAEAEDAVFALQDTARGIFPAVLTDQGLTSALRAYVGRVPIAVRVEIEPNLTGRRFDPEAEAALYFVALEALTNIGKHAPDAQTTISLHGADGGRRLVLEVHDNGPGFSPDQHHGEGAGLHNMRDRIAAVGGNFTIDSQPGAGTWLLAELPIPAKVLVLHPADADSRR